MTKKEERQFIYNMFNGKCAYCGCDLPNRWHVDHIEPVVRDLEIKNGKLTSTKEMLRPENDNINNKFPACPSCNIMKHSQNVEGFRFDIKNFVNSLNKYSNQYKFAKKFGLISENSTEVIFYFERVGEEGRGTS